MGDVDIPSSIEKMNEKDRAERPRHRYEAPVSAEDATVLVQWRAHRGAVLSMREVVRPRVVSVFCRDPSSDPYSMIASIRF